MPKIRKPAQPSKAKPAAAGGEKSGAVEIRYYVDASKRNHFVNWWSALRDDKAKRAIYSRIYHSLASGNYGDAKPLREGVRELRVDVGPGYRVYYAKTGRTVVLLLCGGDKSTQSRDIDRAVGYWNDWKTREKEA